MGGRLVDLIEITLGQLTQQVLPPTGMRTYTHRAKMRSVGSWRGLGPLTPRG